MMAIQQHMESARRLRESGDLAAAEAIYQQVLGEEPKHLWSLLGLGLVARQRGDRAGALDYFESAAEANPEHQQPQINMAVELRELNRLDEAQLIYKNLLNREPGHVWSLLGLGLIARKRDDRAEALRYFQSAAEADPQQVQAQLEIAAELRVLDRLDEAGRIYQQILDTDSAHIGALLGLGITARLQGDADQAMRCFKTTADINPDQPQPGVEMAIVLRDQGDFAGALAILEALQDKFPNHLPVYLQQGMTLRVQGQHESALTCFQQASGLQPTNPGIFLDIAFQQFALGEIEASIRTLQHILELQPDHMSALLRLGDYLKTGRAREQSMQYFQRALKAHPSMLEPYIRVSLALLDAGDTGASFALLDKATEQLGNSPEIISTRAGSQWCIRDVSGALDTLDQGIEAFPDSFRLQILRLAYLLDTGDFSALESLIESLPVRNNNQLIQSRMLAARSAQTQWKISEAKSLYLGILDAQPNYAPAHNEMIKLSLLALDISAARKHSKAKYQQNLGPQKINGRNRDYMHDHNANLIDEYAISRVAVDAMRSALESPAGDSLQEIAKVVLSEPEATAAATTLLYQFRQAHVLDFKTKTGQHALPKNIFQYWDKPDLPEDVLQYTNSWQQMNPGYSYQLFDDRAAREFFLAHYSEDVLRGYVRSAHPAQKADIFRLAVLYECGGLYADVDDLCLGPVDDHIPDDATLLLWQEDYATVGNNVIAVHPKHPVIGDALDHAVAAMLRGDKDSIWLATGPGLMTRSLAHYLAGLWPDKTPADLGIYILTKPQVMQFAGIHGKLAYKLTSDSWLIQELGGAQGAGFEL